MTSMLQLVQQATGEMGLAVPGAVAGNQADDTVQQLALLNACGNELMRQHEWQGVTKVYTFTANQGSGKYAMPADFDRIIDNTEWDSSKRWRMQGPLSAQQWANITNGFIATGPVTRFRIFGNFFQVLPPQASGDTLGFEYVSKNWAAKSDGTPQSSFMADSDTCIFSDRLMVAGLKLKYFSIKGFDTTDLRQEYETELCISKANDAGSPDLSMAPRFSSVLLGWENIPDTNYGH